MGSTKEKNSELELIISPDKNTKESVEQIQQMSTNERIFPSIRYNKDKNWERVRLNILGMLNAFEPTIIDNTEQVKNQCVEIIDDELTEAEQLYDEIKEFGLTANSIECEGYIRACNNIKNKIKDLI